MWTASGAPSPAGRSGAKRDAAGGLGQRDALAQVGPAGGRAAGVAGTRRTSVLRRPATRARRCAPAGRRRRPRRGRAPAPRPASAARRRGRRTRRRTGGAAPAGAPGGAAAAPPAALRQRGQHGARQVRRLRPGQLVAERAQPGLEVSHGRLAGRGGGLQLSAQAGQRAARARLDGAGRAGEHFGALRLAQVEHVAQQHHLALRFSSRPSAAASAPRCSPASSAASGPGSSGGAPARRPRGRRDASGARPTAGGCAPRWPRSAAARAATAPPRGSGRAPRGP